MRMLSRFPVRTDQQHDPTHEGNGSHNRLEWNSMSLAVADLDGAQIYVLLPRRERNPLVGEGNNADRDQNDGNQFVRIHSLPFFQIGMDACPPKPTKGLDRKSVV